MQPLKKSNILLSLIMVEEEKECISPLSIQNETEFPFKSKADDLSNVLSVERTKRNINSWLRGRRILSHRKSSKKILVRKRK